MKTKLLIFSAMAFVMLCFNGCTPDEVVTAQDQFKPYIIRVTSSEPLTPTTIDASGLPLINSLCLTVTNVTSSCCTVGQSQVELQGTAVANTPMNIEIQYWDQLSFQPQPAGVGDCDQITLEIYYDGFLVHTEQRTCGGANCINSVGWNLYYTF